MGSAAIWWVWMGAAMVFAILEVVVPAWIFLGFALGAFLLGVLLALGIGLGLSLPWLLVIFAALSLLGYLCLRQIFGIRQGQVKVWDRDIND